MQSKEENCLKINTSASLKEAKMKPVLCVLPDNPTIGMVKLILKTKLDVPSFNGKI